MNKSIKFLAVIAAITLIGTTSVPVVAAEIYTETKPVAAYGIIPPEQKVGDLKLSLSNKMKYLYADNDTKKADILDQAKFLVDNANHYLSIDVTNFNIVPATIDKEGAVAGNFVISDSRDVNSQIILPFDIPIQCLDTDQEKVLKEKATKIINSMDISKNTDCKDVEKAVTEGLADDSIDVKVSNVYNSANDWSLGDYNVYVYLSNKDKTIDTEFCVKGYIYPTLNATNNLNNIVGNFHYSLNNIYDKDLTQDTVQSIVDKLLTGTSITAKISDYVQIPATDTTYGEVLFSITFTDSRDNSTVTKYFDGATDEPKDINNNQTFGSFVNGTSDILFKLSQSKSTTNSTTLSDIEKVISGTIQNKDLSKYIENYRVTPATTSSDGLIEFEIHFENKGNTNTIAGYTIRIPKLAE